MTQSKFDKRFVLHIGLSKTATTTFQELVFAKHPQVFYLGKFQKQTNFRQCRDQMSYEVLNPMLWSHEKSVESAEFDQALSVLAGQDGANRQIWLASWEELGNRPAEIHLESLRRVQRVFSECRLVVCLRNPLHRVPSEYLQSLRYHYLNFCHEPLRLRNVLQPLYVDFNQWLTKRMRDGYLAVLLRASDLIRGSCEIIGKENVGVFLFEDFCQDTTGFVQSITDFLGVDHRYEFLKCDSQQWRLNTRLTEGQVDYLQDLRKRPWKKTGLIMQERRFRRNQLSIHGKDSPPARATLSTEWTNLISDVTRSGNRWLADSLGLPLHEYGYPL